MTTWTTPICNECEFFLPDLTCKAFPDGIPAIIFDTMDHSKPLPQQKNKIVFTPKKERK